MRYLTLFLIAIIIYNCKEKEADPIKNINPQNFNDFQYVTDSSYVKGDTRRYGVFPNQKINPKQLENIIQIAEKGIPITFSEGFYNTNLILKGKNNLKFNFDNASFSGQIQLIEDKEKKETKNIVFNGTLIIYSKLFIRNSQNINIQNLKIESDTIKSIDRKKSLGCSIYVGSKQITIDSLIINGIGSDSKYYQHAAAALQIHGWNNNPENISINYLSIKSSDRNGVYITGKSHKINILSVEKFGLGSNKDIFPLGDAKDEELKSFAGLWINRCNDCEFNKVLINTNNSKGDYSLKLDEGEPYNPSFIYNLELIENKNKLPILDDYLTNILVKKVTRR